MNKLSKWVLAAVVIMNVFACGTVNVATAGEWADIQYIEGRYSRIYFDYVVSGNTGTFYCINDWMVNQDDGDAEGGLLSNEYNRFNFKVGIDDYEIRIYPDGHGEISVNGISPDPNDPNDPNFPFPGFESACCWTTSPSMPTKRHTVWEFSLELQERMIGFGGCDPPGPIIVVNPNPPEPPLILTSGPSVFAHTVDGKFTDDSADCMLSPVPSRSYQEPVRDPFFDEHDGGAGWTLEFDSQHGGVIIGAAGAIVAQPDDIKWSQPPEEVNVGIINGWDEVSTLDGNCWDCPTQCHGDADCSGHVDQADSDIFYPAYGSSQGGLNYNPCADFDRDGDVDTADLTIMNSWWNTNPPANCPSAGARAIVADDWICMDDRPITDIHWWGSFKGWTGCVPPPGDEPNAFHLGIWTDVPDPNKSDPNNFSHPGKLVWENVCSCYTWTHAGYDLDPRHIDQNEACFKFDQLLSQDEWFYQKINREPGCLDIYVQDDTAVDYVKLTVSYNGQPAPSITKGTVDNFVVFEMASPRPALAAICIPQMNFDNPLVWNRKFGHTISGLQPNITAATLEIRMKPTDTSGGYDSDNDTIALQLGQGSTFAWSRSIGTGVDAGTPVPGLLPDKWDTAYKTNGHTFVLNLAALPLVGGGTKSIINLINRESPNVYWLSIAAIYDPCKPEPNHPWGWKTRPHFYNDDAVRITDINDGSWPPIIGKSWASGEPIEYPAGTSWDMTFTLTTNKKYAPRPGYWPPAPIPDSNSIAIPSSRLDFNNDMRIDFVDFAVFAGQWLDEGEIWPEYDMP